MSQYFRAFEENLTIQSTQSLPKMPTYSNTFEKLQPRAFWDSFFLGFRFCDSLACSGLKSAHGQHLSWGGKGILRSWKIIVDCMKMWSNPHSALGWAHIQLWLIHKPPWGLTACPQNSMFFVLRNFDLLPKSLLFSNQCSALRYSVFMTDHIIAVAWRKCCSDIGGSSPNTLIVFTWPLSRRM